MLLYKTISNECVDRDIFNHMWTINYNDDKLKNILFDLGFGAYAVDAFTCVDTMINNNIDIKIRKAEEKDIDILYKLIEESREYYKSAPLFLKRDKYSKENISQIIKENCVFIACEQGNVVGFMNISISQYNNIIELSVNNCGLIDEIGAYIKLDYRGKGVGGVLVKTILKYCKENNIDMIHVDYETANLYANKFWKKYFNPMLLSVRRTINKNINA